MYGCELMEFDFENYSIVIVSISLYSDQGKKRFIVLDYSVDTPGRLTELRFLRMNKLKIFVHLKSVCFVI